MPSLSDVMKNHKTPVEMLRNSQIGMYVYPVVTPEFRNWRLEQEALRHTAVLFDQSHHMDELIVEGPQAEEFLAHHGINAFSNFDLNRAKHYVPVTPAGHVIGDHIIFRERQDKFILVGRAPTSNWLMFAAAWGKWNVRIKHDPRSTSRPEGERVLRTVGGPSCVAKNRYSLPAELPLSSAAARLQDEAGRGHGLREPGQAQARDPLPRRA